MLTEEDNILIKMPGNQKSMGWHD